MVELLSVHTKDWAIQLFQNSTPTSLHRASHPGGRQEALNMGMFLYDVTTWLEPDIHVSDFHLLLDVAQASFSLNDEGNSHSLLALLKAILNWEVSKFSR